jgi:hypothetical protein
MTFDLLKHALILVLLIVTNFRMADHTVASHCHIDPRIFELDFDLAVSR